MKKHVVALLAMALLMLTGCAPAAVQETFFCMGTLMDFRIWTDDGALAARAKQKLIAYEALIDPDGVGMVAALNRGEEHVLDGDLRALLALAMDARAYTGGAFSPGVYHAARAWGFLPKGITPAIPEPGLLEALIAREARLDDLAPLLSYRSDGALGVRLPEGLALDLGAIAKGWAGDRLYEMMEEEGVSSAVLSLGGNIVCRGASPKGGDWEVGLSHPREDGVYATVYARDAHIVTSADDQRYYLDADGRRVAHIIDPSTMMPARSGLISVSVIARASPDAGAWADALSTAAFVLGREEGISLLDGWPEGMAYVAVAEDGAILTGGDPEVARVIFR